MRPPRFGTRGVGPIRCASVFPIVNTLFAPYQPDAHGVPLAGVTIREADADDVAFTGALTASREGGDPAEWAAQHARRLDNDCQALLVAEHEGVIIAYGWLAYLTPGADGGRDAPDGWYLSGVVVAPPFRRRGVGRRLTRARVEWVLERDSSVFYVVSASNLASRTLHAELGFREVTDDFVVPGVVFTKADGILCRLDARPDADVIDLAARRHS